MTGAAEFQAFIADRGFQPPANIEPGRWMRFATKDKRGDDAGSAKMFPDCEGGIVYDWRTGEHFAWQAQSRQQFSDAERRAFREKIERERQEAARIEANERKQAAERARTIWAAAKPAPADHAYLAAKGTQVHGARIYSGPLAINAMRCNGALILPIRNPAGDIQSLEFIAPDGAKRFLPGGAKGGGYYSIGKPAGRMLIAEGFATGAAVHEATGCAVAIAFDAGNLERVAGAMRQKFHEAEIIIAADDDSETICRRHKTEGATRASDPRQQRPEWCRCNPGLTKALQAALAVGGKVAAPAIDRPADFNDLARAEGAHAVNAAIEGAQAVDIPLTVTVRVWPEKLDEAAYCGLAGEIVRAIEPETESDSAAILLQVLVAFGALVGRGPHLPIEGDQHHVNLFALIVGETSKARKGTSWGRVREMFSKATGWPLIVEGLSSGEGLKWAVRDRLTKTERDKHGTAQEVETDPGVADKRLLVVEAEFAQVLRQGARAGNTLSATIRSAWDSGNLRTLTRNDPITATGAHICIVGHITADELRAELTATDSANGFANRFLFMAARRSKALPFGGTPIDPGTLEGFARRIARAADDAKRLCAVAMAPAAREAWSAVYGRLSEGNPGLFGSVTGRAEAQCLRLALVYALMDGATQIAREHLLAALAVWERAEASARYIFGDALGDPIANQLLDALRAVRPHSITRTGISKLLGRHQSAERISAALAMLERRGLARRETVRTDGASAEHWRAA